MNKMDEGIILKIFKEETKKFMRELGMKIINKNVLMDRKMEEWIDWAIEYHFPIMQECIINSSFLKIDKYIENKLKKEKNLKKLVKDIGSLK